MPMYNYRCSKCGAQVAKIHADSAAAKAWEGAACTAPNCTTGRFKRAPRPASSRVTETLDNGVMARRVERPADAERLFHEHTKQNSRD